MPVSSIWDIPSVEKDGGGAAGGGGAGYSECLDSCLVRCSCPLPNECLTRACLRSLAQRILACPSVLAYGARGYTTSSKKE